MGLYWNSVLNSMYRSGLVDTLVTHANMKGLGRTPSLGDSRGFMPPQLKTKQNKLTVLLSTPIDKLPSLAIRADEAHHRIVNHTLGSMKPADQNPFRPGA